MLAPEDGGAMLDNHRQALPLELEQERMGACQHVRIQRICTKEELKGIYKKIFLLKSFI